ncbi:hypothetical protein, partial [Mesorhizobium sp.]|uniref:hypothetical protein n=1 Tax=Mesorhizobium sp. TaxID=1871066 RepID=UPI0025E01412
RIQRSHHPRRYNRKPRNLANVWVGQNLATASEQKRAIILQERRKSAHSYEIRIMAASQRGGTFKHDLASSPSGLKAMPERRDFSGQSASRLKGTKPIARYIRMQPGRSRSAFAASR